MTKRELIQRRIASILDGTSVYMGGPSQGSMRRALKIIELLEEDDLIDYTKEIQ